MAGPFDFTGQNIENTYQRLVQVSGSSYYDGTGSLLDLGGGAQDLQSVLDQGSSTSIAITSSAETAISASGTGSFGHLRATVIEGNSPLTLKDVSEINFDNADLFGNTIFHSDVNVYSGSAFLDEYDHEIFRSNATTQGVGNMQFGGLGLETLVQGDGVTIDVGDITQPTSSNIFLVKIEDDTKFTINNQGVTILGEQTSTPTAVKGGIYYSSSAFFVGVE
jgi:hypothetical protein